MSNRRKRRTVEGQAPSASVAIDPTAALPPTELDEDASADPSDDASDEDGTEGALLPLPEGGVVSCEPCGTCGKVEVCEHLREGAALPPGSPPRVAVEAALGEVVLLEGEPPAVLQGASADVEIGTPDPAAAAVIANAGAHVVLPQPPAEGGTFGAQLAQHTAAMEREIVDAARLEGTYGRDGAPLAAELYGDLVQAALALGDARGQPPPFVALPPAEQRLWELFAERVGARFAGTPALASSPTPPAPVAVPRGMVRCRARSTVALLNATDERGGPLQRVREGMVCLVSAKVYEGAKKHLEQL
jgi:hypothetical protein